MSDDEQPRSGPALAAGHREIDHTADLGFELWAPSLEELYAEGVAALADLCTERHAVVPTEHRVVTVEGADREERLVRWLQEVYFLLETELWLAADAIDVEAAGERVRGVLRGETYDPERHTLHTEIKAITYHGLAVTCDDGRWTATVVVDV